MQVPIGTPACNSPAATSKALAPPRSHPASEAMWNAAFGKISLLLQDHASDRAPLANRLAFLIGFPFRNPKERPRPENKMDAKAYDEAVAAYQKAIELRSDRAAAHVGLGLIFVKQKKYAEAIAPLRRSLDIEKQSSTPYLFLGLSEMMTGDYKSSEANLLRAYEIGKPALAHVYLANLYELTGEPWTIFGTLAVTIAFLVIYFRNRRELGHLGAVLKALPLAVGWTIVLALFGGIQPALK